MKEALAVRARPAESLSGSTTEKPQQYCLFIPGMQATTNAMFAEFGIHNTLVDEYGEGNVSTFNSAISTDTRCQEIYQRYGRISS